jgi:hypothetical protein
MRKIKRNIIIFSVVLVFALAFIYLLGFKMIFHDYRINLITLDGLTTTPIQKDIKLWFSKGWQIRSEWLNTKTNVYDTEVNIRIKNYDKKPLMIIVQLNPTSVSALSEEFKGFKKIIQPNQQELIYKGNLNDFIGKIIRINNNRYLLTFFQLTIESEQEISFEKPLCIFAYIPAQTI